MTGSSFEGGATTATSGSSFRYLGSRLRLGFGDAAFFFFGTLSLAAFAFASSSFKAALLAAASASPASLFFSASSKANLLDRLLGPVFASASSPFLLPCFTSSFATAAAFSAAKAALFFATEKGSSLAISLAFFNGLRLNPVRSDPFFFARSAFWISSLCNNLVKSVLVSIGCGKL